MFGCSYCRSSSPRRNRNHGLVDLRKGKEAMRRPDPYFLRRRWDYFVENLLGVTPPHEYRLELKN